MQQSLPRIGFLWNDGQQEERKRWFWFPMEGEAKKVVVVCGLLVVHGHVRNLDWKVHKQSTTSQLFATLYCFSCKL